MACNEKGDGKAKSKQYTVTVSPCDNEKNTSNVNHSNAICELLEILRTEYQNERTKKISFETRAGFIIAFLGAFGAFVVDKVLLQKSINSIVLCACGSFFLNLLINIMYISAIATFYTAFRVIYSKGYKNIDVRNIVNVIESKNHYDGCKELVMAYRESIIQYRERNEQNGQYLKYSVLSLAALLIVSFVVFGILNFNK